MKKRHETSCNFKRKSAYKIWNKWHETGGSDCLTKTQDSAKCNY